MEVGNIDSSPRFVLPGWPVMPMMSPRFIWRIGNFTSEGTTAGRIGAVHTPTFPVATQANAPHYFRGSLAWFAIAMNLTRTSS